MKRGLHPAFALLRETAVGFHIYPLVIAKKHIDQIVVFIYVNDQVIRQGTYSV